MADQETNNLAERYDTLYASDQNTVNDAELITLQGWPKHRNEAMVYLTKEGGRLLEIGCGTGSVMATLALQFNQLIGTELSDVRTQSAKQRWQHIPNLTFLNATIEELLAKNDESFDCIIWADVVEHVVDVIGTMKQLAQLSHVGTQLITVTPNIAYLPRRVKALQGYAPATSVHYDRNEGFAKNPYETIIRDGGHLHYFSFSQLETLYRVAGFEPEIRLGIGNRFGKLRDVWPTLLSGAVCVSGTYRGVNA